MSNDETPTIPAKRTCLDNSALPPAANPMQRSAEFWFPDGSVILQTNTTQFRVHRGVLFINSNGFKRFFDAHPSASAIGQECIPVPVLGSDKDWNNLLTFIYYHGQIKQFGKESSFDFLASLIQLGRKYEFDHAFREALQNFKKIVPTTFSGVVAYKWDMIERQRMFELINLAFTFNIQTVLPALYFLCSLNYSLQEILGDSTNSPPSGSTSHLIAPALKAVVIGRDRLRTALARHIFSWTFNEPPVIPHQKCSKHKDCRIARLAWQKYCAVYFGSEEFEKLRLTSASESNVAGSFCAKCKESVDAEYDRGCQQVWEKLPSFFNLPQWKDLKNYAPSIAVTTT